MRYVIVFLELLVAVFAIIGLYRVICWIAQKLFGSKHILVAIEILTQRDAESAEVLIRDALFRCLSLPSGRIVVLTVEALREHPVLKRMVRTYGVDCYVIPMEEREEN